MIRKYHRLPAGFPFGANVRKFRQQKEWTLQELAERTGRYLDKPIAFAFLWRVEVSRSNPTLVVAWAIARALGVRMDDLLKDG